MCHVVAGVSKDTTAVSSQSSVPVPKDDCVCKFPERRREDDEERRWHDEPVPVHGKVVVGAVKEEVQGDSEAVVGKVAACC